LLAAGGAGDNPRVSADTGVSWRPVTMADAADLTGLLNAMEAVDHQDEHASEEETLEEFSDPARDLPRGSIAAYDGATMIAYGMLTARMAADPVHDMYVSGGVHPGYRRRRLGGRILAWAERAAPALHQGRFGGRPLSLAGYVQASNAGAVALYAAHGYTQARWFRGMRRDLATPLPEAAVPAGIEIAGFTAGRSPDAMLVRNESFRDHWGSTEYAKDGWAHFTGQQAFRPEFTFLAYGDGQPLGLVVGMEYAADSEATGRRDLDIPLVGTRRAGRKRGIASALLTRAMTEARAAGFSTALLGVDADSPTGAVGLYERLGFTAAGTWISQRKPLMPAASRH
jgi:mycothiol synthase